MESETKYVINPQPGTEELIIRHGEAAPADQPVAIILEGDIRAPYEYFRTLTERSAEQKGAGIECLIVDYEQRLIMYHFNLGSDLHASEVSGQLNLSPELNPFKINSQKAFGPKELIELFKFNKHRFADREDATNLIKGLQKWNVKVSSLLTDQDDEKGNVKYGFEQKVEGIEFLNTLRLNLPVFRNTDPQPVDVEIIVSVHGRDVRLFLISPHLHELIETEGKAIIDAEVNKFPSDLPILYK